jgi:hypothetical protein
MLIVVLLLEINMFLAIHLLYDKSGCIYTLMVC